MACMGSPTMTTVDGPLCRCNSSTANWQASRSWASSTKITCGAPAPPHFKTVAASSTMRRCTTFAMIVCVSATEASSRSAAFRKMVRAQGTKTQWSGRQPCAAQSAASLRSVSCGRCFLSTLMSAAWQNRCTVRQTSFPSARCSATSFDCGNRFDSMRCCATDSRPPQSVATSSMLCGSLGGQSKAPFARAQLRSAEWNVRASTPQLLPRRLANRRLASSAAARLNVR
mmetsp:Transcript_31533/g.106195  ORF Transcript_31533/g.106195 Transcript_31533/m.106195 type:complete len:228 (+) Transcript_31533:988-1671(+)